MSAANNNRLVQVLADLRANKKKTVLPFVTAGYPDLETTGLILKELESRGVRVCELGVPFSDPIADGPTIQASYTAALGAGVDVNGILDMVRSYREAGGSMALCAMVSYSIVFRRDSESFCADAADAGFDGLIVPDLPLGAEVEFGPLAGKHGLCNVMLIAPTTPQNRRIEIAKASNGFVYCISVAGITGERDKLPPETIAAVAELRKHTDTPLCVGFGISNAETVANVCKAADGAIVGSAIIHRVTDAMKGGEERSEIARIAADFVGELLVPVK
jgi:tryptophan synthase alpha chain